MNDLPRFPRRLIEVDLPIRRISTHASREKSIRHGHISTLHIWWARRPLAACRAVICAALWPDPGDPLCPETFRATARTEVRKWATANLKLLSHESYSRYNKIARSPSALDDNETLRDALLDFIADFANWDSAATTEFLDTSSVLTQAAHVALGGTPGSRPLVFDPFAGGGAIPVEAIRVGADTFASDLNPIAALLNRMVVEWLPKYGGRLADDLRTYGEKVQLSAAKELARFYPKDSDGARPIAHLWARTILCEGPKCGARIPLFGRAQIATRKGDGVAIRAGGSTKGRREIRISIVEGPDASSAKSTCKGFVASCPRPECGYSTPKKSVQRQLSEQHGGADDAMLLALLTDGPHGRRYRIAQDADRAAFSRATDELTRRLSRAGSGISAIPNETIPKKTAHRAVGSQLPLYGFRNWGDLFNARQKLALLVLQDKIRDTYKELLRRGDDDYARALYVLLAFALDKQADYLSSLCRWVSRGEFIAGTLAGEKKLPMMADYAEANPIGDGSGCWLNQIDWIARFLEHDAPALRNAGTSQQGSADGAVLPADSAAAMITDPPYYDSVPYADLSDFFYVWLRRTLSDIPNLMRDQLTPKEREATVNHPGNPDEIARYEELLTGAFRAGREATKPDGIGVIVFAHKSTAGWESLLEAIVRSGWVVTGSWPIDTERTARLNANGTASLTSSVHIVCRPREGSDGSVRSDDVGDWREVLQTLPKRIHEWMPRLEKEGIVGADAIFACLGPALEVFSRYSRVEKTSGEAVTLREYLEHVWAAVSKEALSMIFRDADTAGLEPDARLTAMWLWTLASPSGSEAAASDEEVNDDADEDDEGAPSGRSAGFSLEFDAARKIAQGLGAKLDELAGVVEVKGDKARLLSVGERAKVLFAKSDKAGPVTVAKAAKKRQLKLFEAEIESAAEEHGWDTSGSPSAGKTALDRVHQAMLLFGAGRGEALKRFLLEEGAGRQASFWKLAQALSALYPSGCDEKRWVDGVLARKKALGF